MTRFYDKFIDWSIFTNLGYYDPEDVIGVLKSGAPLTINNREFSTVEKDGEDYLAVKLHNCLTGEEVLWRTLVTLNEPERLLAEVCYYAVPDFYMEALNRR